MASIRSEFVVEVDAATVWRVIGDWADGPVGMARYSMVGDTVRPGHDNAVMQIVPDGADRCRFIWTRDVLPDELAEPFRTAMEEASVFIKRTLEDL